MTTAYVTNKGKSETKIRGITLDYAATKKLNPNVMRGLVHLHVNCHTQAKVTVDIPFKITRDKEEKNIVTIDIYLSGLLARRQNAWSQDGGNMRVIAKGVNR